MAPAPGRQPATLRNPCCGKKLLSLCHASCKMLCKSISCVKSVSSWADKNHLSAEPFLCKVVSCDKHMEEFSELVILSICHFCLHLNSLKNKQTNKHFQCKVSFLQSELGRDLVKSHSFQRAGKGHHLLLVKHICLHQHCRLWPVGEGTACKSEFSPEATEKYTNNSISGGMCECLGQ